MATSVQTQLNVGGVLLDRPFKARRLGHFGFNVIKMEECLHVYTELLGFRISDARDLFRSRATPEQVKQMEAFGDTNGYFTRFGSDHHSFVLFNKQAREWMDTERKFKPGVTINQITWQVGSLAEVGNAIKWFREQGVHLQRAGRDMPGSNWHTYLYDPDGHTNELYYGIEQVGWNGHSKPLSMYKRGFREAPPLPQISEFQEVQDALAEGVDLLSGYRYAEQMPATYEVGGIMMPRPFKIVGIGPVSLFVEDVEASKAFYQDALGFTLCEEVEWQGYKCAFLRVNTEHHSMALYPIALRKALGLSDHTTNMAFGVKLANYQQLRDAVAFLKEHGVPVIDAIPQELHPGIDYAAHVLDPEGHCIQLYCEMEQIGWDGKPKPAEMRRKVQAGAWPDALDATTDTYRGEPFLGPWE